jgi:multisubunit Na+/H+ antiporter MnhB subunit
VANLRNVAIIVVIAAVVAFAPGGGTTGTVVITAVSLIFLAVLAWVASILYREHRTSLYSLGDSRRAALYAAAAVLAVTLTATSKLTSSSGGSVAWLVLVGGSVYTLFAVVWAARRY